MGAKVVFSSNNFSVTATLNDSPAAGVVASHLPIDALVQTGGSDIYFFVDFTVEAANLVEEVEPGTLAYWPAGSALCVFHGTEPVTPVEVIGKLDVAPDAFKKVMSGDEIALKMAST